MPQIIEVEVTDASGNAKIIREHYEEGKPLIFTVMIGAKYAPPQTGDILQVNAPGLNYHGSKLVIKNIFKSEKIEKGTFLGPEVGFSLEHAIQYTFEAEVE